MVGITGGGGASSGVKEGLWSEEKRIEESEVMRRREENEDRM